MAASTRETRLHDVPVAKTLGANYCNTVLTLLEEMFMYGRGGGGGAAERNGLETFVRNLPTYEQFKSVKKTWMINTIFIL